MHVIGIVCVIQAEWVETDEGPMVAVASESFVRIYDVSDPSDDAKLEFVLPLGNVVDIAFGKRHVTFRSHCLILHSRLQQFQVCWSRRTGRLCSSSREKISDAIPISVHSKIACE